jgi:hypothetical protein
VWLFASSIDFLLGEIGTHRTFENQFAGMSHPAVSEIEKIFSESIL